LTGAKRTLGVLFDSLYALEKTIQILASVG
jgi:hypothetical protein